MTAEFLGAALVQWSYADGDSSEYCDICYTRIEEDEWVWVESFKLPTYQKPIREYYHEECHKKEFENE